MSEWIADQVLFGALLIFCLRVVDMSLATLRFMLLLRGKKALGWVFGFAQSMIAVLAISAVLDNLDNFVNVIGYAAGFATGGVVGVYIEGKLAIGFAHVRVISSTLGQAVVGKLRENGFAVTEWSGRGKDGVVAMINVSIKRKQINQVRRIVKEVDNSAFITSEDLRPVRRGHWRA
jgi:uncharacterized protein YebE (UPF0316 family)